MNESSRALEVLISQIIKITKEYCKKLDFDRTYTGVISAVNKDGYTVKYNGTDITIKTSATDVFKVSELVKFCVPCMNKRRAYFVVDLDMMMKHIRKYVDERVAEISK